MASPVEIAAGAAVELFLILIGLAVLFRVWSWFFSVPKRQVVQAFQTGVVLHGSKVEKVLGPGAYWITPKRRLLLCDVRPTPFQVASQELLTADHVGVRVGLAGEYRVVNPALFVAESSDAFGKFYLELRQVLQIATSEMSSQTLFGGQSHLTARMKELLLPWETKLGIEMTQLNVYEAVPVGWLHET